MKCVNCNTNEVPAYRKTLCDGCANAKKLAYEASQQPQVPENQPEPVNAVVEKIPSVKAENGEYQSTVYNRTVAANSYEIGSAGNRFKLYFETPQELKEKMQELKDAGLMDQDLNKVMEDLMK